MLGDAPAPRPTPKPRKPARPAGLENIEALSQRVEVMDADAEAIKALIARTVNAG